MKHSPLGSGPEFDRIRAALTAMGDVARGIGDDVAVVPDGAGYLVVSTDLSIEDIHFRRDWLGLEEIGWRAATAALSDLAAAGAEAVGLLVSVGWPETLDGYERVMLGVGAATEAAGGVVLGGDLSRSDRIVIDGVALGRAARVVTRTGASPGDRVWVTGRFGGPAAAMDAWAEGREPHALHRQRFARPKARVESGQWLAAHGATAMIDVSDGLVADAGHVAAASGVGIRIALETVPLISGVDSPLTAASSGEEYELLVTLPPSVDPAGAPNEIYMVGECLEGSGVETTLDGAPIEAPLGFDHFRGDR